jgi:hypothetical protein
VPKRTRSNDVIDREIARLMRNVDRLLGEVKDRMYGPPARKKAAKKRKGGRKPK